MFERNLSRFAPHAYAILRVVTGLMFAVHGAQKVLGVLTDKQPPVGSLLWIGGVIELVAGVLIALGLFTRVAAFISSGQMAVAYCMYHWKLAFDERFFPVVNKGELAVVYCFLFLYIACAGPGRFSVDSSRGRR